MKIEWVIDISPAVNWTLFHYQGKTSYVKQACLADNSYLYSSTQKCKTASALNFIVKHQLICYIDQGDSGSFFGL